MTSPTASPHRPAVRAGVAALLLAVAGCSSPEPGPAPLVRAAARQSRLAEEAYLTDRPAEAVPALEEAVRLHLAAGDAPGAGRALLNLALARRANGQADEAAAAAGRLRELAPAADQQARERGAPADAEAAAAWLDALLAFDRGDPGGAAAALSGGPPGNRLPPLWTGRFETLRADLALAAGRPAEAVDHARAGRAASAAAQDRAEEARALRLSGTARLGLGQWSEARTDFLAAVRIEESLGGGGRMVGDLEHLAAIAEHLGDPAAARLYASRARAIAGAR